MGDIAKKEMSVSELMNVVKDPRKGVGQRGDALATILEGYNDGLLKINPQPAAIDRMKMLFVLSCKNTPKLLDCEVGSLIKALFTAVSMNLEPDPYFGQVYLIPYGKNVQVIPGYKGLLKLVRNTGDVTTMNAVTVHKNDEFDYDLAGFERPRHKANLEDRGPAIAYYFICNYKDGSFHFELMTKEEVEHVRVSSAAVKSGKGSPWGTHYDEMAKKTVIRRAIKRMDIALDRGTRTALRAEDAAHGGRIIDIDPGTGEAIDPWAEMSEEPVEEKPAIPAKSSRLEQFTQTHGEQSVEDENQVLQGETYTDENGEIHTLQNAAGEEATA